MQWSYEPPDAAAGPERFCLGVHWHSLHSNLQAAQCCRLGCFQKVSARLHNKQLYRMRAAFGPELQLKPTQHRLQTPHPCCTMRDACSCAQ